MNILISIRAVDCNQTSSVISIHNFDAGVINVSVLNFDEYVHYDGQCILGGSFSTVCVCVCVCVCVTCF